LFLHPYLIHSSEAGDGLTIRSSSVIGGPSMPALKFFKKNHTISIPLSNPDQ
jgi:hypothetical protein